MARTYAPFYTYLTSSSFFFVYTFIFLFILFLQPKIPLYPQKIIFTLGQLATLLFDLLYIYIKQYYELIVFFR
jgi:hypothetical protein